MNNKSILVINTPKCCYDCDLCEWDYYGRDCLITGKNVQENNFDITKSRHETCQLKPLPKRLGSASEYGSDEEYIKRLINWKKEIDEILGEENE